MGFRPPDLPNGSAFQGHYVELQEVTWRVDKGPCERPPVPSLRQISMAESSIAPRSRRALQELEILGSRQKDVDAQM